MNKNLHVDLTEEMGQISSESPAVIHVSADLYFFLAVMSGEDKAV